MATHALGTNDNCNSHILMPQVQDLPLCLIETEIYIYIYIYTYIYNKNNDIISSNLARKSAR